VTRRIGGVLGPLATNFDAAGDLDLAAFADNLRTYIAGGQSGAVVCGSTGEAALLDEDERARLIEVARDIVPSDGWLVVGTGAESTRLTIERARRAESLGADLVLVVSPHYYGPQMTPAAVEAHFLRVADASPCPVLLYNIPKYAHLTLEPDLIARLSTHENVVGMKDSAGDLTRLAGYVQSQRDDFSVLTGHGGSFAQALEIGVRGGILAVALFASDLSLQVWNKHQAGDKKGAADEQSRLTPLAAEIVAGMGVAGVKHAIDCIGLAGGPVRSPLLPIDAAQAARVVSLLESVGIATVPGGAWATAAAPNT
jgi:4-hydroxy-2-oxoglutarate aldolase